MAIEIIKVSDTKVLQNKYDDRNIWHQKKEDVFISLYLSLSLRSRCSICMYKSCPIIWRIYLHTKAHTDVMISYNSWTSLELMVNM